MHLRDAKILLLVSKSKYYFVNSYFNMQTKEKVLFGTKFKRKRNASDYLIETMRRDAIYFLRLFHRQDFSEFRPKWSKINLLMYI